MKQTKIMLIVAVVLSGMLAGCATNAKTKQAIVERWEKSGAPAKLSMVETLIEQGRLADAQKTLLRCLEADPKSAHAHFLMGRVHLMENRTNEARLSFAEAITLDASHDAAWYHLGVLFELDGSSKRAMHAYHTALSLQPAETEYIIAAAQMYMMADHPEKAHELLEDRLKRQPRNRDLLLGMADLSRHTGQLDKTAMYYEQIIMTNAKDQEVLEALGYCYAAMKNWNKAAQTFEKLLNLVKEEKRREIILETLAMCTFNTGRYGQALNYYDRLSTLRRDDPDVWLNMAQSALGAEMVERAATNARRALQLRPSWPQAYAVLGAAQYLQENYGDAIRSFSFAGNDEEVSAFAWFMTGRCYTQMGQTAKAEAAYLKAGDVGADSPLVVRFLKENGHPL